MAINAAHWHLLLNHIPVIGVPMVAMLLIWGLTKMNEAMVRLALLATIVMGAATWVADLTGGKAEHEIKDAKYAWVSRERIHDHEEAADKAEIAAIATGVLALGVLVMARGGKPPHRAATYGMLFGLGITAVILGWASWEGGKIRHDEFGLTPTLDQAPIPGETPPRP
ncbi:MAG: hypothetical protein ABIZ70_04620 [Gemmatimonadales bacterium]